MLFGVSSFDRQSIINNTVAFAKATRLFGVPGRPLDGGDAQLFRESLAAASRGVSDGRTPIERSSMKRVGRPELRGRDQGDR